MASRRGVVLIGAGGHARVCIDVLRESGWFVRGCLSGDGTASADVGVPMLGTTDQVDELAAAGDAMFVAIGDNAARLRWVERLWAQHVELPRAVSFHAVVSPSVLIGAGTLVMPGAIVNAGTTLGDGVIINTRASVDHDCQVGDGVHIAPGVAVAGGVRIQTGAFLGIGASVVPGREIGEWSKVGAGSVVIRDVEAHVTVVGTPARPLGAAPTAEIPRPAVLPASLPQPAAASAPAVSAPAVSPPPPLLGTQPAVSPPPPLLGTQPAAPSSAWAPPAVSMPLPAPLSPPGLSSITPPTETRPLRIVAPATGSRPAVLVVCTGNICRSPLTSALLRSQLGDADVMSAGTHAQLGAPADATTKKVAKELGIDLSEHHATPLKSLDLNDFDLIIGLSADHRERIIRFDPAAAERTTVLRAAAWRARAMAALDLQGRQWVERLCSALDESTSSDIEDPIGRTTRHQRRIAREIQSAVESLAGSWRLT